MSYVIYMLTAPLGAWATCEFTASHLYFWVVRVENTTHWPQSNTDRSIQSLAHKPLGRHGSHERGYMVSDCIIHLLGAMHQSR